MTPEGSSHDRGITVQYRNIRFRGTVSLFDRVAMRADVLFRVGGRLQHETVAGRCAECDDCLLPGRRVDLEFGADGRGRASCVDCERYR